MTRLLLITMGLLPAVIWGNSQSDSNTAAKKAKPVKGTTELRKNNVKANLSSLMLNSYSLYYERTLTRKMTVQAGFRVMPGTQLSDVALVNRIVDLIAEDDTEVKEDLNRIKVSNSAITSELRLYAGRKKGAKGFYISVYGRYMNLEFDYPYDFDASGQPYVIPLNGKIKGWGAGLLFGTQWLVAKRIILDWYIIGGHYGKAKGTIKGTIDLSHMSAQDQQELRNEIQNLAAEKNYISANVTNQGLHAKTDSPFVGLRGFGLSIGIGF